MKKIKGFFKERPLTLIQCEGDDPERFFAEHVKQVLREGGFCIVEASDIKALTYLTRYAVWLSVKGLDVVSTYETLRGLTDTTLLLPNCPNRSWTNVVVKVPFVLPLHAHMKKILKTRHDTITYVQAPADGCVGCQNKQLSEVMVRLREEEREVVLKNNPSLLAIDTIHKAGLSWLSEI